MWYMKERMVHGTKVHGRKKSLLCWAPTMVEVVYLFWISGNSGSTYRTTTLQQLLDTHCVPVPLLRSFSPQSTQEWRKWAGGKASAFLPLHQETERSALWPDASRNMMMKGMTDDERNDWCIVIFSAKNLTVSPSFQLALSYIALGIFTWEVRYRITSCIHNPIQIVS